MNELDDTIWYKKTSICLIGTPKNLSRFGWQSNALFNNVSILFEQTISVERDFKGAGGGGGQKVFWKHLYRDDNAELTSKISHILLMFCYDNLLTRTISIQRKDTHFKVPVSLFIECSQPEIK